MHCLRKRDKAIHEENFLSSWLREDVEGKAAVQGSQRRRKQNWDKRGGGRKERVEVNSKQVLSWLLSQSLSF